MIEVFHRRGLYVPEIDLWLDPQGAKPRAFISHAHADHFGRHESVLCSETTATLLHHRFRLPLDRLDAHAFHSPILLNGYRLRLLPAGHIPGSSMLHITRIADNATLLYTGDFKVRRSRTTEMVNFLAADTLVMETTFALPHYVFPSTMEVETELLRFIHDTFADGDTPVLLGYSLGKAQEVIAVLAANDIPVQQHPAVAAMSEACKAAGVSGLPETTVFDGELLPGHVLVVPPHAMKTRLLKEVPRKRTAMLSGWALQPNARFRYGVDAMIPCSDHADYPGLLECIQRVRPKRILTVHGFCREFAADLRERNHQAWCAAGGDQLELPMLRQSHRQSTNARNSWHSRALCPLADFSDLLRLLGQTGSRVKRIEFTANHLKALDADDLVRTIHWLGGNPSTQAVPLPASALKHALLSLSGAREPRYHEILSQQKDPVATACALLQELQLRPQPMTLGETAGFLTDFNSTSSSLNQLQLLSQRIATLHPYESETLLRLLTRSLKPNLDSASLSEAIAMAFSCDVASLRQAAKLTNDLGVAACLAKRKELERAAEHRIAEKTEHITPPEPPELPLDRMDRPA